MFLSSNLTKIDVKTNVLAYPAEVVLEIRSGIKMLPSSVQFLVIYLGNRRTTRLTEEIPAFILGRRESLQEFHSNLVLSTS